MVGKLREGYLRDGCNLYLRRLSGLMPVLVTEVRSSSNHDGVAAVQRSGQWRLLLVIGGDRGLSHAVRERASFVWSLSALTFLHEMARLIVLEQLYRAAKINRGEPYHCH